MSVLWQQLIIAFLVCAAVAFLVIRYFRSRRGKGECPACRARLLQVKTLRRKAESAREN
ncbi:MAG: hypothetical protein OEW00_00515 [candidate division Zixibacteria bacterium]|nr:hypothetical protein [candidate division Zixibacteria bacterium]